MTDIPLPHSEAPLPTSEDTLAAAVKIAFRPFEVGDRHFILKSWLKNHRKNQAGVSDEDYYTGQSHLIFALAARSKIIIACDEDNPSYILGFICGRLHTNLRDLVIHFVYVKEDYRHNGVARDLVSHLGYRGSGTIIATHWNHRVRELSFRRAILFNPYHLTLGAPDV